MTKNRTLGRCSAGKQSSGEKWKNNNDYSIFRPQIVLYRRAFYEGVTRNARRATRQRVDRGDNAEIGRLGRSALCTVHLLQCIFFDTILDS